MTAKKLCFWIRFTTVAVAACGLYLCIFGYPFLVSLSTLTGIVKTYQIWAWLIFLWAVSIPCFVILIFIWNISSAVKNDLIFTQKVAKKVKICAQILFADTSVLFVGGIVFTALRIIDLFIPFIFLLVVLGLSLLFLPQFYLVTLLKQQ